jgi:hypothetical protein
MRLGGECRSPTAAQHGRDCGADAKHDHPGQGLRPAATAGRRGGLESARGGHQHVRELRRDPLRHGVPRALNARSSPHPGVVHALLRRLTRAPGERGRLRSGPLSLPPGTLRSDLGLPPGTLGPSSGRGLSVLLPASKGHDEPPKYAPAGVTSPVGGAQPFVRRFVAFIRTCEDSVRAGTAGGGSPLARRFMRGCQP